MLPPPTVNKQYNWALIQEEEARRRRRRRRSKSEYAQQLAI